MISMMVDPVFMIREESANTIIKLKTSGRFDKAWLDRVIEAKLEELVRHERFMLRIQTIHLINQMKDHCSDEVINRSFSRHLVTLATDPVPNIRFNVSKAMAGILPVLTAENAQNCRVVLEKIAESDSDFDSKFYAQKTIAGFFS